MKKKLILGSLFVIPVTFLFLMLSSKHYYTPLDVVKQNVPELTDFHQEYDTANVYLKDHISVLMMFNEDPLKHIPEISNLNEKAYKWAKGFRDFQVIFVVPKKYEPSEEAIRSKIGEYVDLKYWRFVFADEQTVNTYFQKFKGSINSSTMAMNNHFYIIDKEMNLRGRLDDEDEGKLYGYNAENLAELQKKVTEDLRILFQEYRDKRNGKFDSDQRRLKELSGDEG
ncbi:hypothetical protein SAMN05216480_10817 [Pustulibacterium marinum]|uniref:Protein SCO1/2 n=1 Tax=Pustulibacterium marinum TaxID=1224947 RepID=A0A1I7HA60_9FLAO|nr:hypothetical protein [Pustulibacterium marinum]SFU57482.1 hypothetical protein SAMN05216480_10817 [Pustulibacterium marinum]